jgi:SAM-dependent methyltransferase
VRSATPTTESEVQVNAWEAAYLRFETPEQEIRKFVRRLQKLQARAWPRDAEIVELFCGRGNGLVALERMGFTRVEGIDLSPQLLAHYQGPSRVSVSDCRRLPFANQTKDVLIVQGGLHHLPALPDDLEQTLKEMHRVLRKDSRLVIVEPWETFFLRFAHVVSRIALARRLSDKVDAFASMNENERDTYERWLSQPKVILRHVRERFEVIQESFAWGKWMFVGKPL